MKFEYHLLSLIRSEGNEAAKKIIQDSDLYLKVDEHGGTLLHYCAQYGNQIVTRYLLVAGASVNARDIAGWTPLMMAMRGRHNQVAKILLEAGADLLCANEENKSSMYYLFYRREREMRFSKLILKEIRRQCPDSEEAAKKLVEARCRVDQALPLKDARIVEYMLKQGSSPNYAQIYHPNQTTLHLAVTSNDAEIVKLLLKYGANANAENASRLTPISCLYGNRKKRDDASQLEILRVLLDAGIAPMSVSELQGCFQIESVFLYGRREAVRLLLQSNVINFKDRDGKSGSTVLHYLARNNSPGVAEELKIHAKKLDANALDNTGQTPLHLAAHSANPEMLEFPLSRGAKVNSDDFGHSALFLAYSNVQPDSEARGDRCIEVLLQRDADPQFVVVKNDRQLTVFDAKIKNSRLKLVIAKLAVLEKNGTTIREIIRQKLESQTTWKMYFEQCRELLDQKIDMRNGSVTVFKLLTANEKTMGKYLNSRELLMKLKLLSCNRELKSFYSYYYNTLDKKIKKVCLFKVLKPKAAKVITQLLDYCFDEFSIIIEKIVDYLNEQDLRKLYQM